MSQGKKVSDEDIRKIKALRERGFKIKDIAKIMSLSAICVYKYIKEGKND